ncbi:MAG: DUF423 domain-containing protein [Myxococcales bacterium]|nr:DUF423 domain-containing protein [Myxococcales bacterium]
MNWAATGAIAMAVAVAAGAFGAHGLRERLTPDALGWWQTAAQYHVYHALGLFAVAWAAGAGARPRPVFVAGVALLVGIVLFSGSLYAMALTGKRGLGVITPIGGLAWITGWIALAVATWPRTGAS